MSRRRAEAPHLATRLLSAVEHEARALSPCFAGATAPPGCKCDACRHDPRGGPDCLRPPARGGPSAACPSQPARFHHPELVSLRCQARVAHGADGRVWHAEDPRICRRRGPEGGGGAAQPLARARRAPRGEPAELLPCLAEAWRVRSAPRASALPRPWPWCWPGAQLAGRALPVGSSPGH